MACISPDGKPTESGTKMLRAIESGMGSAEEIASSAGLPLFRVKSGLRELTQAGLANQKGDTYELSSRGVELLGTLSN
jgi:DNA-binding IclR family transcriptional regulator